MTGTIRITSGCITTITRVTGCDPPYYQGYLGLGGASLLGKAATREFVGVKGGYTARSHHPWREGRAGHFNQFIGLKIGLYGHIPKYQEFV